MPLRLRTGVDPFEGLPTFADGPAILALIPWFQRWEPILLLAATDFAMKRGLPRPRGLVIDTPPLPGTQVGECRKTEFGFCLGVDLMLFNGLDSHALHRPNRELTILAHTDDLVDIATDPHAPMWLALMVLLSHEAAHAATWTAEADPHGPIWQDAHRHISTLLGLTAADQRNIVLLASCDAENRRKLREFVGWTPSAKEAVDG